MGLNAGELDKPVKIQQLTETVGPSRFPVESWTTLIDPAWMSREELKGSERFRTGQLTASANTRWRMRYHADMDPEVIDVPKTRRLVYLGWTYDITDASPIGRHDEIQLMTLGRRVVEP